jgi:repressor LexA
LWSIKLPCIDDGDVVIIKASDTAQNGQTVVAWLRQEEEATLKKIYFHENGVVRLQPANSNMAPIFVAADNISVRGTVVSVIRQYT